MIFMLYLYLNLHGGQVKPLLRIDLENLNILKPTFMTVKGNIIFIYDESDNSFNILKDYKNNKKFGRRGDGPGEFNKIVSCFFYGDVFYVYDQSMRLIEFNLDGTFIKEKKINDRGGSIYDYHKLNDREYFSFDYDGSSSEEISQSLFLNSQKKIKLFTTHFSLKTKINIDNVQSSEWDFGKNICFIVPNKNVYQIKTFDLNKKAFSKEIIDLKYQRQTYSTKELEELEIKIKKFKSSSSYLSSIQFEIPKYKQAIKDIAVDESDHLYVITSKKENNQNEVEIYDQNLLLIQKLFINNPQIVKADGGKLYSITEEESYFLEVHQIF